MKRIMYMFAAMLILVSVGSCEKDPVPAPENPEQEQNPEVKPDPKPDPEPEPEIPEYSITGNWKQGPKKTTNYKLVDGKWVQDGEPTEMSASYSVYLHINEDGTYVEINDDEDKYLNKYNRFCIEKKEKNHYADKSAFWQTRSQIEYRLVAENKMVKTEIVLAGAGDSKKEIETPYETAVLPEDLKIDLKDYLTKPFGLSVIGRNILSKSEDGLWTVENADFPTRYEYPTQFLEYHEQKLRTLEVNMTAKTAIQDLLYNCTLKGNLIELRKIKDKGYDHDFYLKSLTFDRTENKCTFKVASYNLEDAQPFEIEFTFAENSLTGFKLPENSGLILENLKAFKKWKNTGNFFNGKETQNPAPGTVYTYSFTNSTEGQLTMTNDKTTTIPFKIQKNKISVKIGGNTQQLVITDFKFDRMVIEQSPLRMIFTGQEPVSKPLT